MEVTQDLNSEGAKSMAPSLLSGIGIQALNRDSIQLPILLKESTTFCRSAKALQLCCNLPAPCVDLVCYRLLISRLNRVQLRSNVIRNLDLVRLVFRAQGLSEGRKRYQFIQVHPICVKRS